MTQLLVWKFRYWQYFYICIFQAILSNLNLLYIIWHCIYFLYLFTYFTFLYLFTYFTFLILIVTL
jgi:hypothetical protein